MFYKFISLMIALMFLSGCISFRPAVDDSLSVIQAGIDAIEQGSEDWQEIFEETRDKLVDETQSTIRNEVSNALNRTVAAAGVEGRCNVRFARDAALDELKSIRAKIQEINYRPTPIFCHPVPSSINYDDWENGRPESQVINIYGYNFDVINPPQIFLHNRNSQPINVTQEGLSIPTHFQMTLNLGGNGIELSRTSDQIELQWESQTIATLAIIQPQLPKTLQEGCYKITHKSDGNVLDGNGDRVYIHVANGGDFQVWCLESVGDGYFRFTQLATGKVLNSNGESVYMLVWNGGDFQLWKPQAVTEEHFILLHKSTGQVLDGNNAGEVYTLGQNGGDFQMWRFNRISELPEHITIYPYVDSSYSFYKDNDGEGDLLCTITIPESDKDSPATVDFTSNKLCENDDARSMILKNVPKGVKIYIHNSSNCGQRDDWTVVETLTDISEYTVTTFERDIEDAFVNIDYKTEEQLDGKVSCVTFSPP